MSKKPKYSIFEEIKPHDRVTILKPTGIGRDGTEWKEYTGRVVMRSPGIGGWVLNMGGEHGTPGLASPENTVAINGKRMIRTSEKIVEANGK